MLACSNVELATNPNGQIATLFSKYFIGGNCLFHNTFTAKEGDGWVSLEQSMPGQINGFFLSGGERLIIARNAYVASDDNITITALYTGLKGWWKGMGVGKLEAKVNRYVGGRVFFNSFHGKVQMIHVTPDHPVIIDNKNVVAYTNRLQATNMRAKDLGGLTSMLFSGEGLMNEFTGEGMVFVGSGEGTGHPNYVDHGYASMFTTAKKTAISWVGKAVIFALALRCSQYIPYVGEGIHNMAFKQLDGALAFLRG
jgi:uncharacterized protein (AIM24 family)